MRKAKSELDLNAIMISMLIFSAAFIMPQVMAIENKTTKINIIDFAKTIAIVNGETVEYSLGNDAWCNCTSGAESNCPSITRSLEVVEGKEEKEALRLNYDLGKGDNCWTQVIFTFNPPLDLSAYDHLLINWQGDTRSANSLEVGIVTNGKNYFVQQPYPHATQKAWWSPLVIPLDSFINKTDYPDLTGIERIFISAKRDISSEDTGGEGTITIGDIKAINISSRTIPSDLEKVDGNRSVSLAASAWIASRQGQNGLLKSWEEEIDSKAHIYDQALALIVFSQEGMWNNSDKLVKALIKLQNEDGSWYQSYNGTDGRNITDNKWEGDVAWVIFALNRYKALGGKLPEANTARDKGINWLIKQIDSGNGCIKKEHVEGAIDSWWALHSSGMNDEADALKRCIMDSYWDEKMGRFKSGKDNYLPVLDVQTWGAALLEASGDKHNALRALSYAQEVLTVSSHGQIGLGDHAGPWTIWNDGTGQYIAAGGNGSNEFLQGLIAIAQQRKDNAMPGSPDNFEGGGFWNTKWHGVAPTAWLYFASSGGPFNASITV